MGLDASHGGPESCLELCWIVLGTSMVPIPCRSKQKPQAGLPELWKLLAHLMKRDSNYPLEEFLQFMTVGSLLGGFPLVAYRFLCTGMYCSQAFQDLLAFVQVNTSLQP